MSIIEIKDTFLGLHHIKCGDWPEQGVDRTINRQLLIHFWDDPCHKGNRNQPNLILNLNFKVRTLSPCQGAVEKVKLW